jgi:hypothetical protein
MISTAQNPSPVRSQYEDFMRHVYTTGATKTDRTGTGTRSVFCYQTRFDLNDGFPLVTTKEEVNTLVYDSAQTFNDSISAEYGVGSMEVDKLVQDNCPLTLGMMRTIKRIAAPTDLMDPGRAVQG